VKTKAEKGAIALIRLEKQINTGFPSNYESSLERWTLLDTIRHANMWKMSALEIVKKRLQKKEAYFHEEKEFEEIDKEIYIVTRGEESKQTMKYLDQVEEMTLSVYEQIHGDEENKDLCPLGYNDSVNRYLIYALIQRPIRRYLYYCVKNGIYGLLAILETYLEKYHSLFLGEKNMLDLSVFYKEEVDRGIFDRKEKWDSDRIYREIREQTCK
jgi:hypothetical protein